MMRYITVLVALLSLTACGTAQNGQGAQLARAAFQQLFNRAESPNVRAALTPEVLATLNQPVLLAELPNFDAQSVLLRASQNGSVVTWTTPDNLTFALDQGVVTATRGFGGDLLRADLQAVHRGLRQGRSTGLRVLTFLDGEDQPVSSSYICDYTRVGRETITVIAGRFNTMRIDEDCVGPDTRFQNNYWIDARGTVRRSRQWLGPDLGDLRLETARD